MRGNTEKALEMRIYAKPQKKKKVTLLLYHNPTQLYEFNMVEKARAFSQSA